MNFNLHQPRSASAPVRWLMLALGSLLVLDSVYLVSVNVTHVGVMVPAFVGSVLLGLALFGRRWHAWLQASPQRFKFWRWGQRAAVVWLLSLAAFFAWLFSVLNHDSAALEPRAIVVLGSSTPNAKPSPTLTERLNLALRMAHQYPQALVVVSGGPDLGQTKSEALVMGGYLQAEGLARERILLEEKSTSTHENLMFSARVLAEHGMDAAAPLLIVTSDFHTIRAGWIAEKLGFSQVATAGAPTPLYMRYNAWTREYFAVLAGKLFREF